MIRSSSNLLNLSARAQEPARRLADPIARPTTMPTLKAIKERCTRTYYKALFDRQAKAILTTPPVLPGTLPCTTLSMVHTRDVVPYLLAFKSFHRQVPSTQAVVVCDPSITAEDRRTLQQHIPHLQLRDAAEFTHPSIPRGGTWERLYAISEYAAKSYTIQLDADTLTTAHAQEVVDGIESNRAFVIGELRDQRIDPLPVFSDRARAAVNSHIQNLAERTLDVLGLPEDALYVRGCSGFTSFSRGHEMRSRMLDFSERMGRKLGERWLEWGTEQVTSNFVAANLPGAKVLPYPKYAPSSRAEAETVFLHFFGAVRFRDRLYERLARTTVQALQRG